MNFGTILNSMTRQCVKLVMEGNDVDSKTRAKSFISYINIKPILKTQFRIYSSLNTSYVKNIDDARLFVTETINTLGKYTFEDIKVYNALLETRFSPPKSKSTYINSNIGNLIKFATSNSEDVSRYIDSLNFMTQHVMTIKEQKSIIENIESSDKHGSLKFLEPKHVVRIAIKKFNEDYGSKMNEEDRRVFNILKKNNEDEVRKLYTAQNETLKEIYIEMVDIDDDLKENIEKSLEVLNNGCTTKNILNAYELIEEIRALNGVDNG